MNRRRTTALAAIVVIVAIVAIVAAGVDYATAGERRTAPAPPSVARAAELAEPVVARAAELAGRTDARAAELAGRTDARAAELAERPRYAHYSAAELAEHAARYANDLPDKIADLREAARKAVDGLRGAREAVDARTARDAARSSGIYDLAMRVQDLEAALYYAEGYKKTYLVNELAAFSVDLIDAWSALRDAAWEADAAYAAAAGLDRVTFSAMTCNEIRHWMMSSGGPKYQELALSGELLLPEGKDWRQNVYRYAMSEMKEKC